MTMPQQITCSECGYCLYEGELLRSPQDVIKKYDGKCPSCNKKLSFTHEAVTVTPYEDKSDSK